MKIPTIKLQGVTAPSALHMGRSWDSQISQQSRRVGGATPKLLGAGDYPHIPNPAKLIPKTRAFANLAGATKRKVKGAM